ncbi:MAG: DNA-processing protein DprA [Polyangia bacterium]
MNALSPLASYREKPDAQPLVDGARQCLPSDADQPARLRLWRKPQAFWLRGQAQLLDGRPLCTVVGSRACSRVAEDRAFLLGQKLARAGVVVVSGGALGIDAAAHRGALSVSGATCAVVGTGIDVYYPKQHATLLLEIAEKGLLLSMFAPGAPPLPLHFRIRNELMAAIADVVVVVEAQERSGSLITARQALRHGRRLYALTGSAGTARLLESGAKLAHSVDEVVDFVTASGGAAHQTAAAVAAPADVAESRAVATAVTAEALHLGCEEAAARVLSALAACAPADVGELCARTGLCAAECAAVLVDLELADRCTRLAGGRYIVHAPLS